jgi:amino acid adenylation domain-containing protein
MDVSAASDADVFEFGPGGAYLGYISEPSRRCSQTGVILFGLGQSEARIARRLAARGIVVMQIRLFKNYGDAQQRTRFYDDSGVAACTQAINELTSRRPVSQVVLMGNCTEANISFNTALVDRRVTGLILTNPHINEMLTVVQECRQNLFSLAAWGRLLRGESGAKLLKAFLRGRVRRADADWMAAQWSYRKDIVLPLDFDRKLAALLTERDVRGLVVFTYDKIGLRYFRRNYGKSLDRLAASGHLRFEVLPTESHDTSADDDTARRLAEAVTEWAGKELVPSAPRAVPATQSQTPAPADPTPFASVSERFDAIARLYPDRLAVRDEERTLTYAELAAESRRIAAAIGAATADSSPVAVLLAHEARFSAAILGVLATGRACVPLDADHPDERNARIAAHSGATTLISTAALAARARALFPDGLRVIDLDQLGDGEATSPAAPPPRPDGVACVIYTSGSTGAPKGVFQCQRGVLQDVMEAERFGKITCEDRIALFYPPSAIAGLRTLLSSLLSGATLEVLPPRKFGRTALAAEIKARGITILRSSPTLFRHLAGTLAPGESFDSVRLLTLGGERVDWTDFDLFQRACLPQANLYVHLGATECWTLHTEWKVDASVRATCPRLPVGRAIPGRRVDIVGEDGEPVPEGQVGEAVVTSRHIAMGYWRDPELTAHAFTVDATDPLQRSYRTGDLVRRRSDGLVEYVGRKDNQIKLHGYRIEPNEVESALKGCVGVINAAVLVRKDAAGVPVALAGYVQLDAGIPGASLENIYAGLSARVPPYMMPAEIKALDELPWLPNFKIDRQRLAQIDAARLKERSRVESVPLIRELIETFEHVTEAADATPTDSIRSLGGDSLQALELVLEISRRFRVVVPEETLDPSRTISQWAGDIAAWRSAAAALDE